MSQPSTPPARLETATQAATSRVVRLVWVSVVLLLPVAWGYVAVVRWPFDGTVVYASSSSKDSERWSDEGGVVVRDTYGNPELEKAWLAAEKKHKRLRVVAVDGTKLADWADRDDLAREQRRAGDELQYTVRIGDTPEADPIAVTLQPVPLREVVPENIGALVLWCLLAVAGPFVFWRRPRDAAACAMLALAAFVPIGMTAFPFGLQVIDFAGGRGMWPYVVGEAANCLAWGTTLFFALMFPAPLPFLIKRPWLKVTPFLLPFVVYAVRLLTLEAGRPPGLARVESLILLSALSGVVVMPVCALVLAVRMRQETNRENRIAILLILTTVLAALVMFVALGQLPELLGAGPSLGLALQPFGLVIPILGLVVAVLRYRLYELDVIVRRSLLVLVAICVAGLTFLGIALLLDRFAPATDRTDLLLGGLIAVLLIPFGRYVRRWLNRLVFGDRDDPYQVVSELRGLGASVSIEDSLAEALRTLSRTLRLGFAAIEVEDEAGGDPLVVAVGEPDLRSTVIELKHHGRPWGRLSLGAAGGREPFGPRDRRLLDDVASQLGALVASLVTNQALRRSRERLISAREEERRRLRRDLHDGLGPALAGQSMQLQYARELLMTAPEDVDPVLERMAAQVKDDIAEIRRLVDDLRPKVLDQLGLVSALQQLAAGASLSRGDGAVGTLMRWTVSGTDVEPLPAAVEVAAYRIVLEAVNNAAKHSSATHCQVDLARVDGHLEIMISDNGTGMAARPGAGVGLGSMRERAEELGGTFTLASARDGGTTIAIRLPLEIS